MLRTIKLGGPQNVSSDGANVGSPSRITSVQPLGSWRGGLPRNVSKSQTDFGITLGGSQISDANMGVGCNNSSPAKLSVLTITNKKAVRALYLNNKLIFLSSFAHAAQLKCRGAVVHENYLHRYFSRSGSLLAAANSPNVVSPRWDYFFTLYQSVPQTHIKPNSI